MAMAHRTSVFAAAVLSVVAGGCCFVWEEAHVTAPRSTQGGTTRSEVVQVPKAPPLAIVVEQFHWPEDLPKRGIKKVDIPRVVQDWTVKALARSRAVRAEVVTTRHEADRFCAKPADQLPAKVNWTDWSGGEARRVVVETTPDEVFAHALLITGTFRRFRPFSFLLVLPWCLEAEVVIRDLHSSRELRRARLRATMWGHLFTGWGPLQPRLAAKVVDLVAKHVSGGRAQVDEKEKE
jgi:hypothetical protein